MAAGAVGIAGGAWGQALEALVGGVVGIEAVASGADRAYVILAALVAVADIALDAGGGVGVAVCVQLISIVADTAGVVRAAAETVGQTSLSSVALDTGSSSITQGIATAALRAYVITGAVLAVRDVAG